MKRGIAWGLAALLAGLCAAAPAQAAGHKSILPEAARAAPGGRNVDVLVPQAELGANINPSMIDVAMGGGLLGVVIDAKIDNDRAKSASASITPLRVALSDFDADALAIDTTKAAAAAAPWFQAQAFGFGRDNTAAAKSDALTAAAAGQTAFFEYTYDTSADFSSIRVGVTVSLADKVAGDPAKPESRLSGKNLIYAQTVTSVVQLPNPSGAHDNAARWTANDGALARRALTAAFADVAVLVPRAMALTEDDLKTLSAGERQTLGHNTGRVVEQGPGGTLLFNGGFVHVQTLQP